MARCGYSLGASGGRLGGGGRCLFNGDAGVRSGRDQLFFQRFRLALIERKNRAVVSTVRVAVFDGKRAGLLAEKAEEAPTAVRTKHRDGAKRSTDSAHAIGAGKYVFDRGEQNFLIVALGFEFQGRAFNHES